MKGPLFLTPYKSSSHISVPTKIVNTLEAHHIEGVRFLYQQCFVKDQNVILNYEPGLNAAKQLFALLTAIDRPLSTLIVCQHDSIANWYYELSQFSILNVVTANELIQRVQDDSTAQQIDVVLISHDQLKHVKILPIEEWLFYVIDDLDLVIKSRFIKSVNSQFRIGVTMHNFLTNNNTELQWSILKWTNPELVEDKDTYIKSDNFNKQNFLRPYAEYWLRYTWFLAGKEQPSYEETKTYKEIVHDWSRKNNVVIPVVSRTNTRTNKRPSTRKISKRALKKRIVESDTSNDDDIKVEEKGSDSSFNVKDFLSGVSLTTSTDFDTSKEIENSIINVKTEPASLAENNCSDVIQNLDQNPTLDNSTDKNESTQEVNEENNPVLNSLLFDEDSGDGNFILDSLFESPKSLDTSSQKDDIPNDESCAILDQLI